MQHDVNNHVQVPVTCTGMPDNSCVHKLLVAEACQSCV